MSSTHVVLHPPPYKSNTLSGFPLVSCHDHVSHQQYHSGVLAGKERWLQQMEQEGPSPMLTNLSQELVELIFEQVSLLILSSLTPCHLWLDPRCMVALF